MTDTTLNTLEVYLTNLRWKNRVRSNDDVSKFMESFWSGVRGRAEKRSWSEEQIEYALAYGQALLTLSRAGTKSKFPAEVDGSIGNAVWDEFIYRSAVAGDSVPHGTFAVHENDAFDPALRKKTRWYLDQHPEKKTEPSHSRIAAELQSAVTRPGATA